MRTFVFNDLNSNVSDSLRTLEKLKKTIKKFLKVSIKEKSLKKKQTKGFSITKVKSYLTL